MKKLIYYLLFMSMQSLANDALNSDLELYDWKEIGRIKYPGCTYISFSNDNKLLAKSGFFPFSVIDIHSYEKMKYTIICKKPQQSIGYLGLLLMHTQYTDISPNGFYKIEIDLKENAFSGDYIIIYQRVLIRDILEEQSKKWQYWNNIKNKLIMSSIGLAGILCFLYHPTILKL